MEFKCQSNSINMMQKFALSDKHSILIEGQEGSGKSYLAHLYSKLLNISDFQIVNANVQDIRNTIQDCIQLNNKIVLCIENLDEGVVSAAYTLLKFLEEPSSHVYIVVTCRNINKVPDTIISRSACVSIANPFNNDLIEYVNSKSATFYLNMKDTILWKCIRTFKDIDLVLQLTIDELNYFENLPKLLNFKDTTSNIVWKLGHYDNNSETRIELVLRYIFNYSNNAHIKQCVVSCLNDLSNSRMASHAVLSKFVFDCKYSD